MIPVFTENVNDVEMKEKIEMMKGDKVEKKRDDENRKMESEEDFLFLFFFFPDYMED